MYTVPVPGLAGVGHVAEFSRLLAARWYCTDISDADFRISTLVSPTPCCAERWLAVLGRRRRRRLGLYWLVALDSCRRVGISREPPTESLDYRLTACVCVCECVGVCFSGLPSGRHSCLAGRVCSRDCVLVCACIDCAMTPPSVG